MFKHEQVDIRCPRLVVRAIHKKMPELVSKRLAIVNIRSVNCAKLEHHALT